MANDGKLRATTTPPKARTTAGGAKPVSTTQQAPARPVIPSRSDTIGASRAMIKDVVGKRPYLKYAFANPYNITLLAGAVAASIITLNPLPAIVALGLEGLWLLHAPESKLLRRLLWDPKYEKLRVELEEQELQARVGNLPERKRTRVEELVARQREIQRLASQNPSFTGELLRGELLKTRRLVDAFIEMSVTCARYEEYLGSVDMADLEKDRRRWENVCE
ncbi:MAG TPA: hypothetical protein VGV38_05555, partial [Pyrinomonadaceae bacterium]|nr:hypothetical protein [Pyrinomonadaceae bacterium]